MTHGITLQAQSPGTAHADLGFWMQSQIVGQPMVMEEAHLAALVETIAANRFTLPRNRSTGARHTEKGTAILEVHGTLINRAPVLGTFWGLISYEGLCEQFRRLATNSEIKRVVLDLNSPGGMVTGIRACADALEELAEKKPVYAIAQDMACSGGYWLGCVAEEVSVTPDGIVGSIGVRAAHVSYAQLLDKAGIDVRIFKAGATKTDGALSELLSDGAAAEAQYDVERIYDRFVAHVARFRPLSEDEVRDTDARVFVGQDAVAAGLADRVETLEELVERIETDASRVKPRRKAKTDHSSKGGLAPASRNPTPGRDIPDDVPSAGKSRGAKLMSTDTAAEEARADLAALIGAAVKGLAADKTGSKDDATAGKAQRTEAEIAEAERTRIFAILESEAAKDKPKLALALAKSGLSEASAVAILAASAPEASQAKPDEKSELSSALERRMAEKGNSAGVKPDAASAQKPSLADKVKARNRKAV